MAARRSGGLALAGALALLAFAGGRFADAAQPASAGASAPPGQTETMSIDPPALAGSTFPALAVEAPTSAVKEHRILLTWAVPGGPHSQFMFSRLSGQTWSAPVRIAESAAPAGPADQSSLIVIDTQSVRRTLIARLGDVVARSGDGGRSWDRLPAPALSFASFAGADEGGYVFWLAPGDHGSAKLFGTRVLAGETLLDPLVAAGSATAAAMTWDGPVVVYRDRTEADAQDIAIVRRKEGAWTPPLPVFPEGGAAAKAPGGGLGVAAWKRQVAVAWYGEAQRPSVLVAFSGDGGRSFDPPVEVDASARGRSPWGPVAVALDEKGEALVLWLALTGAAESSLHLARVAPDGRRGEAKILARGLLSSAHGAPQIVLAGDRVAVAWVEGGSSPRVRTTIVPLSGIPEAQSVASAGQAAPKPEPYAGRGRVGDPLPDLPLVSLAGEKVAFPSYRGEAVLLNFWATWCAPCVAEMPELGALSASYRGKGLEVLGVNGDAAGSLSKVRDFVARKSIPFAVWLDPDNSVQRALRVQSLPTTFVIDRQGRIVLRLDRPIVADDPELRAAIERALGGPK